MGGGVDSEKEVVGKTIVTGGGRCSLFIVHASVYRPCIVFKTSIQPSRTLDLSVIPSCYSSNRFFFSFLADSMKGVKPIFVD